MTIELSQLILHKKEFLTSDECHFLVEEYEKRNKEFVLEKCPEANTNIDTFSTFKRIDLRHGTDAFNIVHSATERMINLYHDYLDTFKSFHTQYRETLMYSHMYRLLKYETGAKIHPHTDHDPFVYGSCTFNLNDDYTGGNFSFWNGKHKIKLGKGDALIFPADHFWVHEVEPIESGVRYSTNSFLQKIPSPLKDNIFEYLKYNSNPNDPRNFDGTRYNIAEKK